MTGQLRDSDKTQLERWIGQGPKQFTLLYSATKDGCVAQKFHMKCDHQGATVTVVYNEQGSVFGGYTSASWAGNLNGHTRDDKAFLFQLKFSDKDTFRKFPVSNATYSIYSHSSYGPFFGGNSGNDMQLFSGTINSSGGFFQLNGGCDFGTNYTMSGVSSWIDVHNGSLKIKELEVYSVAVKSIVPVTTEPTVQPWIDMPEWNTQLAQELVQQVKSIKPSKKASDKLQLQYYRILLIGPVGSGKSSFCNTVNNVFKERLTQLAISGEGTTSITTTYEPYVIKTTGDSPKLHMRLCDTRGLDPKSGIDTMEFNFLLSGHIPDKYEFNAEKSIALDDPLFVMKPTMAEKPHCVVFVFDATSLKKLDSKLVEKIKSFRIVATRKQISQAVLLTKIDLQDKA
ncbi:uncharacterized protein LOC127837681 isoform X2 [Dreissena polymorpha]|nr:uncharacterized protein LOC127837681 isoform X2 [Dreissena polymorpha]XP_052220904.1 uncharacterized protein LOC127837681 isoform X2 [Dreissena polymorpha]